MKRTEIIHDGGLVGFIAATEMNINLCGKQLPCVEIHSLCLHPLFRSQHLAPKLIKEIATRCTEYNICQALFTTSVNLPIVNVLTKASQFYRILHLKPMKGTQFFSLPSFSSHSEKIASLLLPPPLCFSSSSSSSPLSLLLPSPPPSPYQYYYYEYGRGGGEDDRSSEGKEWVVRRVEEDDLERIRELMNGYLGSFAIHQIFPNRNQTRARLFSGSGREKDEFEYVILHPFSGKLLGYFQFHLLYSENHSFGKTSMIYSANLNYFAVCDDRFLFPLFIEVLRAGLTFLSSSFFYFYFILIIFLC